MKKRDLFILIAFFFILFYIVLNSASRASKEIKFREKYEIGNITFFFYNITPYFCDNGEASGCALPVLKTIYMINHSYEGYEGLMQLCNHEVCHIYEGYNTEDICRNTTNIYWECEELVRLIKSEN